MALVGRTGTFSAAFSGLVIVMRTRAFWLLAASFAICGMTTNGLIGTHFIPAAGDHGMPTTVAAGLLATIGIFDVAGIFRGRCDFYWDEFGVVGEADGRDKYDGRDVLWDEKERQEDLERLGIVVVRWGWTVATRRAQELRRRLTDGFERGRLRDRSGSPRKWSIRPA